jgi:hypothetical protein
VTTHVGYVESTSCKDALIRKWLIPRSRFELSHRLPRGRGTMKMANLQTRSHTGYQSVLRRGLWRIRWSRVINVTAAAKPGRAYREGSPIRLPLLGCHQGRLDIPDNLHHAFKTASRITPLFSIIFPDKTLSTFVFYNIPASAVGFPQRSFVFYKIPVLFVHFLKNSFLRPLRRKTVCLSCDWPICGLLIPSTTLSGVAWGGQ